MFRDEDNTGFYRPKRPTTYVDTNLSGRALEVYWHEDPRR
jgi:hypothetical protein